MTYIDVVIGDDTWSRVLKVSILLCLYPIIIWVYSIFFHPLAEFPGPVLWSASRLPYICAVWGGRFPYDIQKLHAKYGDTVRIAPNELSFTDPTAWDDIYSNREGSNPFSFRKSEHSCWHGNSEGGAASVFVTINSKEHSRIRRFIDPAFSERAVLQQEPILQEYVDLFLSKIHEQCSARSKTTVNIVDWLNFTLFDTIGELVFGESFRCLEKREYEGWMAQMAATIKLQYLSTNLRHYPLLNNLLRPIARFLTPKDITAQQRDHRQRSEAKLKRRLSPTYKPDGADIVSKLVRSDDREQGLTYDEVTLNSILFINAASETTATVLTGVINNLLEQPESLFKLQTELQRFSMLDDLTLQSLKSLPYLNAVLKEGLRMCNPNPIGHMRISPVKGGIVSGQFVPGNTMVTVQPLALSMSPEYFHDAEVWHPERWLSEAETNPDSPYFHDCRKSVRAFGWGQHNCVGEPLAWAWMRLIIAKMLWTFDLQNSDTSNSKIDWDRQKVFGIIMKHRLDVFLVERIVRS